METERRTVVVSGVPDVLPPSRMTDKLTIHFQTRRRSHGGDVEVVEYPTSMSGVAFVTFYREEDAERVVRKERHIMADSEFPEDYDLTVFLFSRDVFCYVSSATVDLFIFGSDQATLIESLRSAHRSIRFRPLPQERKALIEGPFSAVRALRHDLIRRAGRLKSAVSAAKLRGTPPNPRVMSPPVSHGLSKAEREPLGSSDLSTPPGSQSTGEASEVQSRLSKAKAQTAPRRQKVLDESVARGGSYENGAGPRVEMFSEYTREQMKASGVDAGIISSLSGLETSAVKPEEEVVSQNHTSSRFSNTDFMENRLKNTSTFIQDDPKDVEDFWVDSCTFRYLQTFHKTQLDGCLKNAYVVEGRDLTRIALTGSQTSHSASRLRESLENLKDLMDSWQSKLRVHEVPYSKAEFPDERELARICDSLYHEDVLYTFEDSCIRVVGPSWSSHLFCEMVKIRIRILKGMVVKP